MSDIDFIPAYSTEVESVLRETMRDRDDEAVKDDAAVEAERSQFDNTAADRAPRRRPEENQLWLDPAGSMDRSTARSRLPLATRCHRSRRLWPAA
jgi:hypothetical protein